MNEVLSLVLWLGLEAIKWVSDNTQMIGIALIGLGLIRMMNNYYMMGNKLRDKIEVLSNENLRLKQRIIDLEHR